MADIDASNWQWLLLTTIWSWKWTSFWHFKCSCMWKVKAQSISANKQHIVLNIFWTYKGMIYSLVLCVNDDVTLLIVLLHSYILFPLDFQSYKHVWLTWRTAVNDGKSECCKARRAQSESNVIQVERKPNKCYNFLNLLLTMMTVTEYIWSYKKHLSV